MAKGMFTQGISILVERAVSLDEIEAALADFEILKRVDSMDNWEFGGPTLIVAFRREANGLVAIDTVDRPWPDHMGDPKTESTLFAAWSMGHFGPMAYPGSLERASQQSWAWKEGETMPARHKAFIRIRASYAFGAEEDDPIMPSDYEALPELEFVTKLAVALLDIPGALCYFNPNGELLRDQDGLREMLNFGWSHDLPPLDAWCNIRLFNVNDEWSLMDSVGNEQLDIPDAEACFHSDSYDFGEVDNFLRNVSLYVLKNGEVINDGDTMDGPGDIRWQAHALDEGICDPPRRVLRWFPQDGRSPPAEVLAAGEEES